MQEMQEIQACWQHIYTLHAFLEVDSVQMSHRCCLKGWQRGFSEAPAVGAVQHHIVPGRVRIRAFTDGMGIFCSDSHLNAASGSPGAAQLAVAEDPKWGLQGALRITMPGYTHLCWLPLAALSQLVLGRSLSVSVWVLMLPQWTAATMLLSPCWRACCC